MTIDETPRGPGSGGESPGMGRSRTTARDLERYAGLFARRTQGMKSSAMRDMMAITARPEVISLAGGLPDTSTFPSEDLAALMARVAAEGPTYPGAVPTFSAYQADVVQVEMDADGMRIDLLEETLDRLERERRTPKFIYTVPSFHNPAGVTM